MARRGNPKAGRRPAPRDDRPSGLGSHWRSDGAPKTAYADQREAWSMADERRNHTGVVLSVYRCDVCTLWHMGNSSGRER